MNGLTIAKGVVGVFAGAGVRTIVDNAIKATTPQDITRGHKVLIKIGTYTIGGMAGMAATNYVNQVFADGVKTINEVKKNVNGAKVKETTENLKAAGESTTEIFNSADTDEDDE